MGYSAQVDLQLRIDGKDYELCKTGPDFIVFREPVTLVHGHAELMVIVDGKPSSTEIYIEDCVNQCRVKYERIG